MFVSDLSHITSGLPFSPKTLSPQKEFDLGALPRHPIQMRIEQVDRRSGPKCLARPGRPRRIHARIDKTNGSTGEDGDTVVGASLRRLGLPFSTKVLDDWFHS